MTGQISVVSHRSCPDITTRSKVFSGGKGRVRVSRIFWSVKALSSAGIRMEPILSKAR
ncbi:hypothetical protein OKW43_008333 [Paraburkholderia sp. WC7.3g]